MTDVKKSDEETARRIRGRPFPKGNLGRPTGSRNKTAVALEALLDGQAEEIIKKAAAMARQGDHTALKLCFERILGARRDRPVSLELPPVHSAQEGATALAAVIAAVAEGQVTPSEGAQIAQVISAAISVLESSDFERRLEALEKGGANDADGGQR